MSKEANNYTTKSNSTPLPTGKGVRLIISGGGTGGHIFPAISIANAIKELCPDAEILFVGAEGRMEMQRVPDAGYRIIGLPVAGFDRKHLWKNFSVLLKLIRSLRQPAHLWQLQYSLFLSRSKADNGNFSGFSS